MDVVGEKKPDNLSTLRAQLRDLELECGRNLDGDAFDAGDEVVNALRNFSASRFRFGKALASYKAIFAEERSWMEAAELIGKALGRSERTIRRILADYHRANRAPSQAIEELEALGVDPSTGKAAAILSTVLAMPTGIVLSDPKSAVAQAIQGTQITKRITRESRHKVAGSAHASGSPSRIESDRLNSDPAQHLDLGLHIRMLLGYYPLDKRLEKLFAALEEMMFDWDFTEPVTVTLTPRPAEES